MLKKQTDFLGITDLSSLAYLNLDMDTRDHCYKVAHYASALAVAMGNQYSCQVFLAALLHDIGKSKIPKEILCKPGELTSREWEVIKQHPVMGYHLIKENPSLMPFKEIVLYHHERFDGKGYPCGLMGDDIPLTARMISIADAFDTMTSTRVYREKISIEQALKELVRCSGTQFDPDLVRIFVNLFKE